MLKLSIICLTLMVTFGGAEEEVEPHVPELHTLVGEGDLVSLFPVALVVSFLKIFDR
jgi:hypothetical protein